MAQFMGGDALEILQTRAYAVAIVKVETELGVELDREMCGEDGGPPLSTRFSRIDDDAIAVADAIGREVMQNLLARQAAQVPRTALPCPDCGEPCERVEEDVG